jgi:hypothetical protein
MVTYQCCSLTVPDDFVECINDYAFKFLWSGKNDKIKRKTIIANYSNGGLKMLDIKSFLSAQKAMWVKRLYKPSNGSWKAYPKYILNTLIGMDSFKTQLNTKTNNNNVTPFYWNIIKNWVNLSTINKENIDVLNIRRQTLWLNKYIMVNKKEIKWNRWIEKKILIIHDIIDSNGAFLTANEIEQRYDYKCDILQYNSLKDAIPKIWRDKLKTINIQRNTISAEENPYIQIKNKMVPVHQISNKIIYWKLINEIKITPVTKDKWILEFGLHEDTWNFFLRFQQSYAIPRYRPSNINYYFI